ncbi:hypothetical protein [Kitasatospora sp. NBC_01266]|uniref:hypothetical protein n=1 Tax=Kitasatospora sp. NBC_01266 TaxID=2903572 RepID=UPI002E3638AA|nr:hypothetical protein [Kitasatospora sp. NBC_01266]
MPSRAHPGRPGRIHRLDLNGERLSLTAGTTSSHGLGLGGAVELARELDRLPQRLVVYAVEGAEGGLGFGLSAPVAAVVDRLTERIAEEIALSAAGGCRPCTRRVNRPDADGSAWS